MRIELILTTDNRAILKEELLLHKLHNCSIVTIEIINHNYSIISVKKVLFCGIDKQENEIYKIKHLDSSHFFRVQNILNFENNMEFINKLIIKLKFKNNDKRNSKSRATNRR